MPRAGRWWRSMLWSEALKSNHLAGAAIDVFPDGAQGSGRRVHSPLRGFDNVLLTPHVGGSTEEAQENIGLEVAEKLIKYSNNGSTLAAVNFPEVSLPQRSIPGNTVCCTFITISPASYRILTPSSPRTT